MYSHAEGEALGRYRLARLIGSGGMGDVYLARDVTLRRDVAVKFVTTAGAASDVLTRRLLQEARAVAALDHPGICPVHDVGVDGAGRPYMVMQYVPGETLAARLTRGPLPVGDALRTCAQIADALAAAHRRGIIHRDLKPQNVMLMPNGQPKLLDFGIAKVLPTLESTSADTTATNLTQVHGLVGTPAYMSPEQIQQQPLDGRSDLFSLGCIVFECLTGRRAFDGRQAVDVLGQVLHMQPKTPSTLRPGLDARYDELCQRLLAKDPSERFQSAEEVVGAFRLLQPDISAIVVDETTRSRLSGLRQYWTLALAVALTAVVAVLSLWLWTRPRLPTPPADAARYYQLGTDALREGAFHSAAKALTEAVRLFPSFALAYARLAEAHAEMDDDRAAAQDLVRVSDQVPDTSRLPQDERLRLEAIRALVLGDPDAAVRAYRELTARRPNDAGAWVDLARAQRIAEQLTDARVSVERAVSIDPLYAAAFLLLGTIDGFQGQKARGLAAFAEAERLYRATSDKEGETEVLIRRGSLLNSVSDFTGARDALERARDAARTFENPSQQVSAAIELGSVLASEGHLSAAEQIVSAAVKTARDAGLETIAADGLVNLAGALSTTHAEDAERLVQEAIVLAERRNARRAAARAKTQLASLQSSRGANPADVLKTLEPALSFFREHKYRKFELMALLVASRAYKDLDDLTKARQLAEQGVQEAKATGDDYQLAIAWNNLAQQAMALGSLPEALGLREQAEDIHRRQHDATQLAFDLTNRAEVLIYLGRFDDAERSLTELDDGARKGVEAYVTRQRRVAFLRALSATLRNRFDDARSRLDAIPSGPASSSTSIIASAIDQYVDARTGRTLRAAADVAPLNDPSLAREREWWLAAALRARGEYAHTVSAATAGLEQAKRLGSDELAWRFAAIGTAAARAIGNTDQQRVLHAEALAALGRLKTSWGDHVRRYVQRPDLIELRKASELED